MQCPFIVRRSDAEDGAVPPRTPWADGGSRNGEQKGTCLAETAKGLSNRPFPGGTSIGDGNLISETGH